MIRHKKQRGGFVIVVVLCIIIMLSVVLLCFNRQSVSSLRAAESLQNDYQAFNSARSALNIVIAAIANNPDIEKNNSFADLFSGKKTLEIDSGRCSVNVADENGRINLNKLADNQGNADKTTTELLLRLIDVLNRQPGPHIDYDIVPAIIDWIDSDDTISTLPLLQGNNLGAESVYYMKLNPPYKCRNMPLDSIDELLAIKGVTAETFERIRSYITIYGEEKININTAPEEVIESLSEKMDTVLAQAIIDKRKYKFFDNIAELRRFSWMTEEIYNKIRDKLTTSPKEKYYTITAGADNSDGPVIIATVKLNNQTKKIDVVRYKELSRRTAKL
jgi:general secretion pathway protein K